MQAEKVTLLFFFGGGWSAFGTCQKPNSHQRLNKIRFFLAGTFFFSSKNMKKPIKIKVLAQKVFILNPTPLFIFLVRGSGELDFFGNWSQLFIKCFEKYSCVPKTASPEARKNFTYS